MKSLVSFEIVRICKILFVFNKIAPQTHSLCIDIVVFYLQLAITYKIAVEVGLRKLSYLLQISIVKLEVSGILI